MDMKWVLVTGGSRGIGRGVTRRLAARGYRVVFTYHASAQQAQALLQAYPNLAGIIAPTTVGIQAAAQELQQEGKCGKIQLTGLGLPNDMRKYVKAGCANKFGLWDESKLGYLATYVAHDVIAGKLTGKLGQTFTAGSAGKYTVVESDGNKPVVVMGPPLAFTPQNIDKYHF